MIKYYKILVQIGAVLNTIYTINIGKYLAAYTKNVKVNTPHMLRINKYFLRFFGTSLQGFLPLPQIIGMENRKFPKDLTRHKSMTSI